MKDADLKSSHAFAAMPAFPLRAGARPSTTKTNPHSQLDQMPAPLLSAALLERLSALPGVIFASSRRAPPGTVGLHLREEDALGPEEAFLIDREFAHLHPENDGSLHLVLPEPLRGKTIAGGWAESHPLAGQPTVSACIVMVYAPRNEDELEIVVSLVAASWRNARGLKS
jgi:hypothetical protein